MKRAIYILLLGFLPFLLNAQTKIDKHLSFAGKDKVVLNIQISDSIRIRTWDKNEVYVTASININENKDNAGYETEFTESGSSVVVKAGFIENYFKGRKDHNVETEINWVVYVPERADMSVESINADITITGQTGPMHIKSISGFIDLTVPGTKQASLDFSTLTGTVYTNHLITLDDTRSDAFSKIRTSLNNGGTPIKLETISGDIFFRK